MTVDCRPTIQRGAVTSRRNGKVRCRRRDVRPRDTPREIRDKGSSRRNSGVRGRTGGDKRAATTISSAAPAPFSFPLPLPLYLASPSLRLSAGIPPCVHSTVVPRGGSRRPRLARTVRRAGVDRITRQASRARDLDDTTSAIRGRTVGRPAFTRALPFDASRKARAREGTGGRGSEREHEGEGEQSEENESCRRE